MGIVLHDSFLAACIVLHDFLCAADGFCGPFFPPKKSRADAPVWWSALSRPSGCLAPVAARDFLGLRGSRDGVLVHRPLGCAIAPSRGNGAAAQSEFS